MSVFVGVRSADEDLVAATRARAISALRGRDRAGSLLIGAAFLATAVSVAVVLPWHRPLSPAWAAVLVLAYAAASRIEFPAGPGSAVPTQLVFVPMLFLLPPPVVPLAVLAGYLLAGAGDHFLSALHRERILVVPAYCWFALGPALVLSLGGGGEPRWGDWPLYAAALGAQLAFDFVSTAAREAGMLRVPVRRLLPALAWVYAIDALLAPVALLTAAAAVQTPAALALAFPLLALLALLAHERRHRIDRALELDEAYRGATREARSDPLTGVANRLAWDEAIAAEEAREPSRRPVSIVLVDLDGLKVANDTLGHDAGDALLHAIAGLARAAAPQAAAVARVGGDEFALLLPATDEEECREIAARLARAVDAAPPVAGLRLSAAIGYASCADGGSLVETQQLADRRMYGQKRAARLARNRQQGTDLLVRVLEARDPGLDQHGDEVARIARAVGRRLGMPPDELDELTRAAQLHDVGKVAVPDRILAKADRLQPDEWEVVRTHPAIGAHVLDAVPALRGIASIVRASHERYDGRGYPDGRAGDEIPLAARIVFACDAFDAMTSARPYRPVPMTPAAAIAELRRCAGTQFDPDLVEHLAAVVGSDSSEWAFDSSRALHERATGRPAAQHPAPPPDGLEHATDAAASAVATAG